MTVAARWRRAALGLFAATALLAGCQNMAPPTPGPSAAPVQGASVVPSESDSLEFTGSDKSAPIVYGAGQNETISWPGSGSGVAELKNQSGQVVYRVSEGGQGFSGAVPAGSYTLTLTGVPAGTASAELAHMLVEPSNGGLTRTFAWGALSAEATRGAVACKRTCSTAKCRFDCDSMGY